MGFSVTAANVIFFIAALTAASAANDAWWESTRTASEARSVWSEAIVSQVRTNLTLHVQTCDSGCNPSIVPNIDIRVTNTGTTVIDVLNLTFVIDGIAYTKAHFVDYDIVSPSGIGATSLILPGETMEVDFEDIPVSADYDDDNDTTHGDDLPVHITTGDGVVGRR